MNNNFTNTELLIQYLDGELDKEQLDALTKSIQEDPTLAGEMESLRLTKETMKSYGLKNKIASIHTEMMQERSKMHSAKKPGIIAKLIPYSMRIAAAVIVLIGITFLYPYYTATPEKLFDENFQAFNLRQARGNAVTPLKDRYINGDMAGTVQQYRLQKNDSPEDNFLAGNAYLYMHKPAEAIAAFSALQLQNKTNNTHYFEEDTEYYLGLAYLLNHQEVLALPVFEKINTDKNHAYHKKVGDWFLKKAEHIHSDK
jgi:hypothetical protein